MGLYLQEQISTVDVERLKLLSKVLDKELTIENGRPAISGVEALLDAYSFAATKHILQKARAFTDKHGKKLMIIVFDPYRVLPVTKKSKTPPKNFGGEIGVGLLKLY